MFLFNRNSVRVPRSRARLVSIVAAPAIVACLLGETPARAQSALVAGQQAELLEGPPVGGGGTADAAGVSVAVKGDLAVLGAYLDNPAGTDSGSALVFERTGAAWTLTQKLLGNSTSSYDYLGRSVATDGETIVVGAYLDDPVATDSGGAFAFVQGPDGWVQAGPRLQHPTPGTADRLGISVDVDGDWIVAGAYLDNHTGLTDPGSAHVYWRDDRGTPADPTDDAWIWTQMLTAASPEGYAQFGLDVALEGDRIVVGENLRNSASLGDVGAAHVFLRTDPNGTPGDGSDDLWELQQMLTAPVPQTSAEFGRGVAVSGNRIAVGAHLEDVGGNADAGAAYTYTWDAGAGFWFFEAQVLSARPAAGDHFAFEPALQGQRLALGAHYAERTGTDSGAAEVYERVGGAWTPRAELRSSDVAGGDYFGFALALDGDTLVTGAHGHDEIATDQGAAYVHILSEGRFVPYCFGDDGGTPCPCTNPSESERAQGCRNSTGLGGGLALWGSDSISADDLVFSANNLIPSNPALLFAGTSALDGGLGVSFGDGLRCAGVNVVRLGTTVPNTMGVGVWGPGLASPAGFPAGATRYFQAWYRDPLGGPCGTGFNLTNAMEVGFTP